MTAIRQGVAQENFHAAHRKWAAFQICCLPSATTPPRSSRSLPLASKLLIDSTTGASRRCDARSRVLRKKF